MSRSRRSFRTFAATLIGLALSLASAAVAFAGDGSSPLPK